MKKVSVAQLVKDNDGIKQLNSVDIDNKFIEIVEISRPGVELFGFFDYYSAKRVQLYGLQEYQVLKNKKVSEETLEQLLQSQIPLILFARDQEPPKEFLKIATTKGIPVFKGPLVTSKYFSSLYEYLEDKLAPETQVHGVMLSIYGLGVLIKGPSGIGKSEVALELIKKGHQLVADDAVKLRRVDSERLIASAPELLQNKMEIRGIGIVDIQKLYGVTSVMSEHKLDLIIELTRDDTNIERIGKNEIKEDILEVAKVKRVIPILTGKNISNLIEVAVADFQLRKYYGYNASEEFIANLNAMLLEQKEEE